MVTNSRRSLSEFLELPNRDTNRLELLDGEVYPKAPLDEDHETLIARVGATLDEYGFAGVEARILMERGPGQEASSPIPDVVFFKTKPLLKDDWPKSPPDLVMEVLAPKRNRLFMRGRVGLYLAAGTPAVWVVDIERHCLDAYDNKGERRTYVSVERATTPAVPGLALAVGPLFLEVDRRALATAV